MKVYDLAEVKDEIIIDKDYSPFGISFYPLIFYFLFMLYGAIKFEGKLNTKKPKILYAVPTFLPYCLFVAFKFLIKQF